MSLIKHLGIEEQDLRWWHMASCKDMPFSWFFEDYETDKETAKQIDQLCLSCPVNKFCFDEGVKNKDWGVRGGVYMNLGRSDKTYNKHKTQEIWRKLKKLHG